MKWDDTYNELLQGKSVNHCLAQLDEALGVIEVEEIQQAFNVKVVDLSDTQVGGSHYKDMAIQPIDYIVKNGLSYLDGNVIKYISRHRAKNGAEDIHKAIDYCKRLLKAEYAENTNG